MERILKQICRALMDSYQEFARPFPWKNTRDPYKIWLSEIILQQTRTEQGLPYYNRIIQKYPDIETLANANESVFLKDWEGLGYYSRARNLLYTARVLRDQYQGVFPDDYKDILALKGVGPYTAAAIASFAFGQSYPVVDGNVFRLFTRIFALTDPIDVTSTRHKVQKIVGATMGNADPAVFNQAIMNLGATVCTPKNPNCNRCPVQNFCQAYTDQLIALIPVKKKKIKKQTLFFNYFYIPSPSQSFAMLQRDNSSFWKQMYEFPVIEESEAFSSLTLLSNKVQQKWNLPPIKLNYLGKTTQSLSHRHIHARLFRMPPISLDLWKAGWVEADQQLLNQFPLPKLIRDLLIML